MRTLVLALALGATTVYAQEMSSRSLGFHVSSLNGFALDGSARGVQGLDYSAGASVSSPEGVPVLHRIILDRSHNMYFGYDLVVTPGEGGRLHLHFAQLTELSGFQADFATFHRGQMATPADQTVGLDEAASVPLELDAHNQPMLVDTLRFTRAE